MNQLISVNKSKVELKEISCDAWETVKTFDRVYIGKNGFTKDKREGDMKTPLGLFKIGIAFSTTDLNINYPCLKITENSYWVDDINSNFYNMWVEIGDIVANYNYITSSDKITWNSAEHLIDYPTEYEQGFVIEYNTDNREKGKGSAIFFHVKDKDYTAGCIAVNKEDMEYILNWLDKDKEPHILIEN